MFHLALGNSLIWSDSDKGNFITCTNQSNQAFLKFTGDVEGLQQLSSIRALYKLPTHEITYFEVVVVNGGKSNGIAIGISTKTTKINYPPGWDRNTIGYHGDGEGSIWIGQNKTIQKPGGFKSGDIVRCMVRPSNIGNMVIYNVQFYKNGETVGSGWITTNSGVYPTVAMYSENAEVTTSFGSHCSMRKGAVNAGKVKFLITLK